MDAEMLVERHGRLLSVTTHAYNWLNLKNKFRKGRGNSLKYGVVLMNGLRLEINGTGNVIEIGDLTRFYGCSIIVNGNDNYIRIGDKNYLNELCIWVENDGNRVELGNHVCIHGDTQLAALEKTRIIIGDECLFADGIRIRTGDSHSLLDMEGNRINPSQDIVIGSHVWIGYHATCLKGSHIGNDCVVAATATVCGSHEESNCVLAGVPAKVVKRNVNWSGEV